MRPTIASYRCRRPAAVSAACRTATRFRIDPDGLGAIAPVVFEFDSNGVAGASDVIQFDHFTTQDVLADRVATAILGRFGVLKLNAKNSGGGIVVLDGTTPRTVVDTTTAPNVANGFQPPTQDEMAERIIAALDGADGVTDSQVLGLTLPSMAAGDVVNGAIVLGGTRPVHRLEHRRPVWSQSNRDAEGGGRGFRADCQCHQRGVPNDGAAGGGPGQRHVDRARCGRRNPAHHRHHRRPRLDADRYARGGPAEHRRAVLPHGHRRRDHQRRPECGCRSAAGGRRPPGLITVINTSGLNVSATQLAFPNDNVIALDGTLIPANTVTFSPGATALRPQDIVPIYVDGKQTPNDVAERIFLAIEDAVRRGQLAATVIPHMNANLGYDDPSIRPSDYRTNRINVEGLKNVTFSSGVASPVVVEGLQGWNDPAVTNQALVPFHTDMTRTEVATSAGHRPGAAVPQPDTDHRKRAQLQRRGHVRDGRRRARSRDL